MKSFSGNCFLFIYLFQLFQDVSSSYSNKSAVFVPFRTIVRKKGYLDSIARSETFMVVIETVKWSPEHNLVFQLSNENPNDF